jgi:hypothetical protein
MQSFLEGKVEGFDALLKIAENGSSVAEICSAIEEAIYSPLEKNASEDDVDFRRGMNAVCFDFLKQAGDIYAMYPDADENDILEAIFEKVAEEQPTHDAEGITQPTRMGRAKNRVLQGARTVGGVVKRNPLKSVAAATAVAGTVYGIKNDVGGVRTGGVTKALNKAKSLGVLKKSSLNVEGDELIHALGVLKEAGLVSDDDLNSLEAQGLLE